MKTYGKLEFTGERWKMVNISPFVCIKLKAVFTHISATATEPFLFGNLPEDCLNLEWFTSRYPLEISEEDRIKLEAGVVFYHDQQNELEEIFLPGYEPKQILLNQGLAAREYQLIANDLLLKQKRLLLGDEIGLGKTLTGILTGLLPDSLPMVVVVQTHLPTQWKKEIERFTNLSVHLIKGTKPYDLPDVDVFIFKYSCLSGWTDIFTTGYFKTVVFDEVQELRRSSSLKYEAADVLSRNVFYCLGMSATPVYNYGDEIFNILDLIKPGCLGKGYEFFREWATPFGNGRYKVKDPAALGSYLKDNYLFLRRTRKDVGRELPAINKIVHYVDYDHSEVKSTMELAKKLAIKVVSGSFIERGSAARELDLLVRQQTGVAKAKEVAAFVRMLVESGEPVVLGGWHRRVYEIWAEELSDLKPVFYTGTESPSQKNRAFEAFTSGETDLFIISVRSGIGLDGLQNRSSLIVIGELDWSPKVHDQLIGRLNREGQKETVSAIFTVAEYGSDPVVIDLLGLKSAQAEGIVNPLAIIEDINTDESRIKKLANTFLEDNVHTKE